MFTMAAGPRGEHLEIWYYAGPDGPTASSIKYEIPADQMTAGAFRQAVLQKYGQPTARGFSKEMLYCSDGEPAASCLPWVNKRKTYLQAETGAQVHSLYLVQGTEAAEAYKAAFSAEVERRAPRDARPSF
jgi:DNA/RNA-binding domain of Phe-tRNA-synthetase-like protein